MKNRYFSFIIAILLFVPGILLFTACGGNGVKLSNLYVVDSSGERHNSFYYAGEYTYGVSLTEILTGIKIKADYSDSTSKELSSDDYTTVYKKITMK